MADQDQVQVEGEEAPASFDFGVFKDKDTVAVFSPRHPVTDKLMKEIKISVVGNDSTIYKQCRRRALNQKLQASARRQGKPITSAEALEDEVVDLIARCMKSWSSDGNPTLTVNGQALAFSYDNAVKMLTECSWLRLQLEDFIEDRANFLAS